MSQSPFKIRPATLSTSSHELLVDFQDSQIPWLTANGSGGQWGTEPIREARPESSIKTRAYIERSERQAPWGSGDWCRAYIAEADDGTPVAGLVLEDTASAYVRNVVPELEEGGPYVYLTYLISNRRAGEKGRGVGKALIEFTVERAREVGVKRVLLDCWRGNEKKLVRYYESQGFTPLADFTPAEKDWPGCVMEMRL